MDHKIDGNRLVITIDEDEQAELWELEDIQSDMAMTEFLEPLVANSELQWVSAEDTGDLTDAPMLGICGEESTENKGPHGAVHCGHWDGKNRYHPIVNRWAYMDYQIKSPLQDLRDNRQAVFAN